MSKKLKINPPCAEPKKTREQKAAVETSVNRELPISRRDKTVATKKVINKSKHAAEYCHLMASAAAVLKELTEVNPVSQDMMIKLLLRKLAHDERWNKFTGTARVKRVWSAKDRERLATAE